MSTPNRPAALPTNAARQPHRPPLISISPAQRRNARDTAYRLFSTGRYAEAEIVCRGLIAAGRDDAYPFVLYVGTLFRLGRWADAAACADDGLRAHPGHERLLGMRAELEAAQRRAQGASAPRPNGPPAAHRPA